MSKGRQSGNPAHGIQSLAKWETARSRAAAVLDVLVANGSITEAVAKENLDAATRAVLDERRWEGIQAAAKAHSSNETAIELSAERKQRLFEWLDGHLNDYKTKEAAARAAESLSFLPLGYHQIRRHITEYCKERSLR